MKQTIVLFLTLATAIGLYAQDCDQVWHQFDSATPSETGEDMAVDGAGNVFVSASNSNGTNVMKFSPSGSMIWSAFNNNPNEETTDISVDGDGNVVVSGYVWQLTTGGNYAGTHTWIAKYDDMGNELWRQSFPVYMFQIFSNDHLNTHAHGSNGAHYLAADDNGELKLYKLSSNGSLIWERSFGNPALYDYPTALDVSGDGRVLMTGNGANGGHIYLAVYDENGSLQWEADGPADYDGVPDARFTVNGNIELLTRGAGGGQAADIAVLTYDPQGNLDGTLFFDPGFNEFPKAFNKNSGAYYFICEVTQATGLPYTDWLTVKGGANGNVIWSDRYDGTANNDERPKDIHFGPDNALYVTGKGGPQYPHPSTGLSKMSNITLKYAPSDGSRLCTIVNQDESSEGQRVLARSNGDFYVLGDGDRDLYKYGVGSPPPTCDTPTGLTTSNITDISAELSWTAVTGAQSYNVRYRPQGASAWTTQNTANTTIVIDGLMAEMPYEWQVATVCS
ncbi:MAG TPA: fibronectin type III domain-containing protein, partial [Phaeodactylibacter sp.]|nr:fibronectin type III domain-containing protein [Phaeodactylibacter sp.]